MKKITVASVIYLLLSVTVCFAGTARITVVHVKPEISVVKYEFRYGRTKEINPLDYSQYTVVVPETPTVVEGTCDVSLEGSGTFYVSVKDYYQDGTESEYSEPVEICDVPANQAVRISPN